jgi:hypothetical protein
MNKFTPQTPATKPKYITNRELLEEIHQSKVSFSYFVDPKYSRQDAIIRNLDEITEDFIEMLMATKKVKLSGKSRDDLVFRLMTYDHIPLDPERKRKARNVAGEHAKVTFPAFKHYAFDPDGNLIEVGRSHWQGDLETGEFCPDKGQMSRRLAEMFMLLVERYSKRGNWRGYCVDEATEALTKRGWLTGDEITVNDTILSYDQGELKWSKIKSIFRDDFDGNMFHLTADGFDALVTPGHKFITRDGLVPAEDLLSADEIILTGSAGDDVDKEIAKQITGKSLKVSEIDFHGGFRGDGKNQPTVLYKGQVWCPETEYGSFMARRNGTVYLTGNTYVDEMRGLALLQLSQVGLQFDESKSDNPFAFYTTSIRNCLAGDTLILTREHGSVPIEQVAGTDVTLLDGNGDWVKSHVYDHGIQETQRTYFQGGFHKEEIWSTLNHGWVSNGKRVNTEDFEGHNTTIDDLRPSKRVVDDESYRRGIVHGMIYGDGTPRSSRISLKSGYVRIMNPTSGT